MRYALLALLVLALAQDLCDLDQPVGEATTQSVGLDAHQYEQVRPAVWTNGQTICAAACLNGYNSLICTSEQGTTEKRLEGTCW